MGLACVFQVHEKTLIVLFVHKSASLHRALLSRVAVVNSGFFGAGGSVVVPRFPHGELLRYYERRPAAFDSAEGRGWLETEAQLLEKTELTFEDLVRNNELVSSQHAGETGKKRLVCAPALS